MEYKTALSSNFPKEIEKLCPVYIFGIDQYFCPMIWYGLNHLAENSAKILKHFNEDHVIQHFQRNLKLLDNIKARISSLVEVKRFLVFKKMISGKHFTNKKLIQGVSIFTY